MVTGNNILKGEQFDTLSPEEEKQYLIKIKEGDKKAKQDFILHNMRLVMYIVHTEIKKPLGMEVDDLIQEGYFGLVKAVEKFEMDKNVKFSTYASYWIKQNIQRACVEKGTMIRLPNGVASDVAKAVAIKNRFTDEKETSNIQQVAREMKISEEEVQKLLKLARLKTMSCFITGSDRNNDDDEIDLLKCYKDNEKSSVEEFIVDKELRETIFKTMNECLNGKEKDIILKRFGLDYKGRRTLDSIGKELNLSRERIRQIEKMALEKLARRKSVFKEYI